MRTDNPASAACPTTAPRIRALRVSSGLVQQHCVGVFTTVKSMPPREKTRDDGRTLNIAQVSACLVHEHQARYVARARVVRSSAQQWTRSVIVSAPSVSATSPASTVLLLRYRLDLESNMTKIQGVQRSGPAAHRRVPTLAVAGWPTPTISLAGRHGARGLRSRDTSHSASTRSAVLRRPARAAHQCPLRKKSPAQRGTAGKYFCLRAVAKQSSAADRPARLLADSNSGGHRFRHAHRRDAAYVIQGFPSGTFTWSHIEPALRIPRCHATVWLAVQGRWCAQVITSSSPG